MRNVCLLFIIVVLAASVAIIAGESGPQVPASSFVLEGSYTAKGEVRSAEVSADGRSILFWGLHSVTMLDTAGNVMWTYVPPEKIKEGVQTYVRFAYATFGGAAVLDLKVGDPHSDELWPYALIGIDRKGKPKWKSLEVGELSVQSPTGETILTTGRDFAHTLLIDAKTGKALWKKKGICGETAMFSSDGKRIVISTLAGPDRTTILDTRGNELWSIPIGLYEKDIAIAKEGRRVVVHNWSCEEHGYEYDLLLAFDSVGKEMWRKRLCASQIRIDDLGGRILIGDASKEGGKVKLLGSSGEILWESASELGKWRDNELLYVSPDGKSVAFTVEKDGVSRTYELDATLKLPKPMTPQSQREIMMDWRCGKAVWIEDSTVKWFRRQPISPSKEGVKQ